MSLESALESWRRQAEVAARKGDSGTALYCLAKASNIEKRLAEANNAAKRPASSDWLNDAFRRPASALWSR